MRPGDRKPEVYTHEVTVTGQHDRLHILSITKLLNDDLYQFHGRREIEERFQRYAIEAAASLEAEMPT